jgi:hypothetical protein
MGVMARVLLKRAKAARTIELGHEDQVQCRTAIKSRNSGHDCHVLNRGITIRS